MALLSPLALAWLLLLPVLILLHLRRRARDRRAVSNLFLWRAAADRAQARPHLSRLATNLQLLLQMLFVIAATLALAAPVMSCRGSRVAFVIDTSASMQAVHDGRSRMDAARAAALERLDDVGRAGAVGVVTAGDTARIEEPLTTDRVRVRDAIARVRAGSGRSDLDAAVALAWSAFDPPPTRVVVFTDVSAAPPEAALERRAELVRAGEPAANVGIARLAVRRHPGSGFDAQVLAAVANFGPSAARVPLRIVQGGRELHAATIELSPGGRRVIVADTTDPSTPVTARIGVEDALAADDEATTGAAAPPALVAAIGPLSRYVRAALAANPLIAMVEEPAEADVVVCEGCRDSASPAPLLVLQGAGSAMMARLAVADPDHPAVSFAPFGEVTAAASPLAAARHERVLVTADGAPVVTASEQDGHRVIHAGLDVSRGPLAASTALPIFVANAVEWLRGDSSSGDARTIAAAESDLRARDAAPAAAPLLAPAERAVSEVEGVPLWRAGLVAALAVLALLSIRFAGGARHRLRVAVAVLLIAALAGLEVAAGAVRRHVVFVLDASASMAAERNHAAAAITRIAAEAQPGDDVSLVTFGREALVEARRVRRVDAAALASQPGSSGTDIAAALRLARALAAPGGRVVLLSDGNETRGDARAEARRLGTDRIPVDVVPPRPDAPARAEVLVASLSAAAGVRARAPFEIVAEIAATAPQRVTVRLLRQGSIADERQVSLGRGTSRVAFMQRAGTGGVLRYDVEVSGERDVIAANNRASALVIVGGPARVLYVSPTPAPAGAALLQGHGFDVVRGAAAAVPIDPSALDAFDAVVLDDVPARGIDAAQRDALVRYVEENGGGLVVTGVRAFGPGGWTGTRVEALLPIDMRPPGRRDASESALVLVLDKSGSMADVENGARKIDVAIRAAAPLVDLFAASRTIGVLAFDTSVVPLVRLGEGDTAASLLDRMRGLTAGGGTTIAPAVTAAREWLLASRARRRHIVLLSDGRSSPSDRAAVVEAAGAGGITISTVGVGAGVEQAGLAEIAARSGGRAYFPGTLAELPEIFMQEATLAASAWRVEEPFTPAAGAPHAILRDVDAGALGSVGGYVATTAKTSADVVLASHRRDPLLAGWTRGLGRAAALTTDLQAGWTDALRASPAFAQVWAQTLRWAARPRDTDRLHPDIVVRGTTVTLAAGAFTREGGFLNGLDVRAAIEADGGEPRDVAMTQTAPGRYEADPIDLAPGFHTVRISASGGSAQHALVTGVHVAAAPEHAAAGPDEALLGDVARLSGGTLLQEGDSPFARAVQSRRTIETRGILIAAALLLFVADVAVSRGFLRRRARARQAAAA